MQRGSGLWLLLLDGQALTKQEKEERGNTLWERGRFFNSAFVLACWLFFFSLSLSVCFFCDIWASDTTSREELEEPQEHIIPPQTQKRRTCLVRERRSVFLNTAFCLHCQVWDTFQLALFGCGRLLAEYQRKKLNPKFQNYPWVALLFFSSQFSSSSLSPLPR